jgi:predicted pyridoxine 5'-phosphate oxidase superfamily flavin-nucleotide-binding protein
MTGTVSDVAFSPSVKAQQEKRGSRAAYARVEQGDGWPSAVTPDLAQFIAGMTSFYLATTSADGQPYVQHRGGPAGFLKVLDETTLGFADYGGNRQYITLGNLAENPKAFIFLMDYARRIRVKLWGTAHVDETDDALLARLSKGSRAAPQRAIVFKLAAWDRNCPQHIPQLVPIEAVQEMASDYDAKIAALEAEVARLRGGT